MLDNTPLIKPTITIIAMISILSDFANFVTIPPILFAIPVSNKAPPTMNMATKRITLLSMNPANAVLTSSTPVTTSPQQTIIDVTPSGIFSNTNITTANARNNNVIVDGLISRPPSYYIVFVLIYYLLYLIMYPFLDYKIIQNAEFVNMANDISAFCIIFCWCFYVIFTIYVGFCCYFCTNLSS